jgi:hypothetical protein
MMWGLSTSDAEEGDGLRMLRIPADIEKAN